MHLGPSSDIDVAWLLTKMLLFKLLNVLGFNTYNGLECSYHELMKLTLRG